MTNPKHLQLVEKLYKLTTSEALEWTETSRDNTFAVSFPNHTVSVAEVEPAEEVHAPDEPMDYLFTIINQQGKVIESFRDTDAGQSVPGPERQAFFDRVKVLYEMARRKALGTDQAIDDVLKELDDILPF
jgi:hypothetical protein